MKRIKCSGTCLLVFLALALNAYAQAPNLGTAGNFAVLAGSGITSADSGTTIVGGNVGSSPTAGAAITGLLAAQVAAPYTLYTSPSGPPATAQVDLTTAYNDAASRSCTETITSGQIGSGATPPITSLGPGVYCFSSSAMLIGTLTLAGSSSDVWIFRIGSSLTTATGSTVAFTGGASPCNVFWQVTSSATIQTGNTFAGVIMALASITLDGGTLTGRALARNGAVTISGQEAIISGCSVTPTIVLSPLTSSSACGSGATTTETATLLSDGVPLASTAVYFIITGPGAGTYGPYTTGLLGTASFTVPALALSSPPDSIQAQFTDSTSTLRKSNITTVSCVNPPAHDTTPPTVTLLTTTPGPPKEVILSLQDTGTGLGTVIVNTSTNATVVVAPFVPGTISVVGVTATKINQSASAVIELTVTDQAGNKTVFDPVFATITIPASKSHAEAFNFHHEEVARFDGISRTEGVVLLQNNTPGVDLLVISVNGSEFRTHLSDGETKKINISSALFHGANTVTVAAFGDPGSSVDLTISDGN